MLSRNNLISINRKKKEKIVIPKYPYLVIPLSPYIDKSKKICVICEKKS